MNPNNELIQAAKAIDAYARPAEADDVLEPGFVPLLANLRTAIARAEASASQPAPATDAEIDDAMWRYRDAAIRVGLNGDGHGSMAEYGEHLRALIARRVAEARAETQQELADLHAELDEVRDERDEARDERDEVRAEVERLRAAASPVSEAEIEAWRDEADSVAFDEGSSLRIVWQSEIDEAVALIRRAQGGAHGRV